MSDPSTIPSPVLYEELSPHIALVTLNRPEKRNAVSPELAIALEAAVRKSEADANIRAVILTSSVDKVFCAGADLQAIAEGRGAAMDTPLSGFAGFVYALRHKPWIAAVEGMALGGGFEIILACDMIVASEQAQFGLPEVKRGLIAGAGGTHRIATVLPRNIAYEMMATGEPMTASRAHHFGLVNRVAPVGSALSAARELADIIALNAPVAVKYALQAARQSAAQPDGFGRTIVAERLGALKLTEDFYEGPRAFVEKRAPVWTGR